MLFGWKRIGNEKKMPKNQKEIAYRKIRDKIINGSLKPGQPITEEMLCSELDMSRTPIREALIRLQYENLVSIIERKGAIVNKITPQDVVEIFQIRLLIEPYATQECVELINTEVLEKIRSYLEQLCDSESDMEQFTASNKRLNEIDDLHNIIMESSGNKRLVNLFYTVHSQILRTIYLERRIPGRLSRSIAEHLDIVTALLAADGAQAATMMKDHLQSNLSDLTDVHNYKYLYKE